MIDGFNDPTQRGSGAGQGILDVCRQAVSTVHTGTLLFGVELDPSSGCLPWHSRPLPAELSDEGAS
jgi:hypothetical protein